MKDFDLFKLIKMGMKAVPEAGYAVGVGAVVAVVAIILSVEQEPSRLLFGTIAMFGLMILLAVFVALVKQGQNYLKLLGCNLATFVVIMFMWISASWTNKHFSISEYWKQDKIATIPQPSPSPSPSVQKIDSTQEPAVNKRLIPLGFKQPNVAPSSTISTEAYEIIGHVIDGTYADATIQNSPVNGAAITIHNRQTGEEFNATSGDQGKFSITLPTGSYKITATHNAFNDENNTCNVSENTKDTPCKIVFRHRKEDSSALGMIAGWVRDEQGRPLAGVHVSTEAEILR